MEIIFEIKYAILLVAVCTAIAIAVTVAVYFRNREAMDLSTGQLRFLAALRFTSFFLLSVLILSPLVKTNKKQKVKPIIIAAFDNSTSVRASTNGQSDENLLNQLNSQLNSELRNDYSLIQYSFGEEVKRAGQLQFDEKRSDYTNLINTVYNTHFNENIGAMLLIGDGIFNHGSNPLNAVQKLNFPIYSVGTGDTSVFIDTKVISVYSNQTAFLNNQFPVEIGLGFAKLKNQRCQVVVSNQGKALHKQQITPRTNNQFISLNILLDADKVGLQHYTVTLECGAIEPNKENNHAEFVVNILENKQKVLIISEGAHPDGGAIKNSLDILQNYEVSIFTEPPYPENVEDFNLVVLNQVPTSGFAGNTLIENCKEHKTPVLFMIGGKSHLPQFNSLAIGAEIFPLAGTGEDVKAEANPNFQSFNLSEEFIENIAKLPPLQAPFADYNVAPAFNTLLYQQINGIPTTKPLLVTGNNNGWKTGILFGEGIWRWRLYDYYLNENHDVFNGFVSSLAQYLALCDNEDNFMVTYTPAYNETDPVLIGAEVYNDAYEPLTEEDVTITITDSIGNDYQYTFDRYNKRYRLDAGILPAGDYTFQAAVTISGEEHIEEGKFAIMPVNIESTNIQANHNLLFQLSSNTGGEFYGLKNADEVFTDIKNNPEIRPTTYVQTTLANVLNVKLLFVLLLVLFSLEWFLRKFWGIY